MLVTRRDFLVLLSAIGLSTTRARANPEGLAVVAHPSTDVLRLNDVELEGIFLTERRYWSGTKPIIPFNLAAHSEERVYFDQAVLRMDPDAVARFWRDRRVRSGSPPPRQVPDPLTVLRLVAKLEGAIGYAPESIVTHDVRVVARIRNGKVQPP
jgi:ABC-type phosphate transport system substrate-binding protein